VNHGTEAMVDQEKLQLSIHFLQKKKSESRTMEQSRGTKPDVGLMQYYTELNESRETMNFKGRT